MQQKSVSSKMRVRMRIVLIIFILLGFIAIISQLFMIQIVHGEMYQERAARQQTRSTLIGAKRGEIYDRNHNTLARSATVWNVCLSPADIDLDRLDEIADGLAEILEINRTVITEAAQDRSKFYLIIKRRVDNEKRQEVLDFITREGEADIPGVFFELTTKRYYPYNSLASNILGFTNYDNQGAYGIEAYYNKVLSGTSGMILSAKDGTGADMDLKYSQVNEPKDGNSLVLTIDESIQHILERNLETAVVEHSLGNKCAGIVMEVKTGKILAMSTKPDFNANEPYVLKNTLSVAKLEAFAQANGVDPNQYDSTAEYDENSPYKAYGALRQELLYDQWRNKAVSDPYEPGSVFKIITAAAAIDNQLLNLNEGFYCNGSYKVADHTFHCWKHAGHGAQNFTQGMQNSCNPVFIAIGQRIGGSLFYNYMESFGFGSATGIDLPGEDIGIMQSLENLSKPGMVELSSNSFGQSVKVTPLQMITAASAAVNGGNLMQPYVVHQILDSEGRVIETTQPVVRRQVVSAQTSETVRSLVEAVVDGGSGKNAAVPGYRIGGKTGTSEKLDIRDRDVNILSFIGFAPMDDPQYAVLIMLDEPKLQDLFGSTIAAPVVGAVLQEMLPYVGLEPQYTAEQLEQKDVEVPDLTGMAPHDAQAKLTTEYGLRIRYEGSGPTILRQIPQAWQTMPKGGTVIVFTDNEVIETGITIPDVVGLSAQEANLALLDEGLNIELRGVTTDGVPTMVQQQWPLAGSTAATGDVVIVTLVRRPEAVPTDAQAMLQDAQEPEPEPDTSAEGLNLSEEDQAYLDKLRELGNQFLNDIKESAEKNN